MVPVWVSIDHICRTHLKCMAMNGTFMTSVVRYDLKNAGKPKTG